MEQKLLPLLSCEQMLKFEFLHFTLVLVQVLALVTVLVQVLVLVLVQVLVLVTVLVQVLAQNGLQKALCSLSMILK